MRFALAYSKKNPTDDASGTPHSIVIRSLRRRLWLAFRVGDADKALHIYKAKRSDWERWTELEKEASREGGTKSLDRQWSNLTLQPTDDSQDVTGLLQLEMSPSEFFRADDYLLPNDSYDQEVEQIILSVPLPKQRRREPLSIFRFGEKGKKEEDTGATDESKMYMTTPLHEAARLGCGELVRLMLGHESADCQKRNGQCRTVFHMVAGGVIKDGPVGIGPLIPRKGDPLATATNRSKIKRFFHRENKVGSGKPEPVVVSRSMQSRVDAVRAIIQWSNQHDAFSTNSVDSNGRSALHYAAELGRDEICYEVLSSFGANLTIVDDTGRNACELAADQNHHDLAAWLEAKAVLYRDPFGMDDELYLNNLEMQHLKGFSRTTLVPPFSWFETLANVQRERERRRKIMEEKMTTILAMHIEKEEMRTRILARNFTGDEVDIIGTETGEKSLATLSGRLNTNTVLVTLRWLLERVRSCHADILLSSYEWNVKNCVGHFYNDPIQMLKDAGLEYSEDKIEQIQICLICCEEFDTQSAKWWPLSNCLHRFCRDCLSDYVSDCASSQMSYFSITCPHHNCNAPMMQSELAELVRSSSDYASLVENANTDFVVCAHDVRHCPHPGCTGAVKFNSPFHKESSDDHSAILEAVGAACTCDNDGEKHGPLTYEGVSDIAYYGTQRQPKIAHRFCFTCGEGMHWPISCHQLEEWKQIVKDYVGDVSGIEDNGNYKDVAQKLWMKANTRPCPKCQAPIQKSDGCNHMTCRSCRYEFCWICSEDWKQHSTETGGFFRCNRWIDQKDHETYGGLTPDAVDIAAAKHITDEQLADPSKMEVTYGTAMHEARISRSRTREMARFLHHYRRWNAHLESATLERKMRDTVCERLAPVVRAAAQFTETYDGEFNFDGHGLSFIHAAFTELLECRSALQHSYACSYISFKTKPDTNEKLSKSLRSEKHAVEKRQAELETMTEQLSDVVARSHLRATQTQILFLTSATAEKRKEFSNIMVTILAKQQKRTKREVEAKRAFPRGHIKTFQRENAGSPSKDLKAILSAANDGRNAAIGDETSKDEVEAAIRASLARFMLHAGELDVLNVDSDDDDFAADVKDKRGKWSCCACTYINCEGFRCDICGTARSELSSV